MDFEHSHRGVHRQLNPSSLLEAVQEWQFLDLKSVFALLAAPA